MVEGIADTKVTHPLAQRLIQYGGRITLARQMFFKLKGSIKVDIVISARCGLLCSIYNCLHFDNTKYPLAVFSLISQQRSNRAGMCVHRFVALPLCVFFLFCFPHYLTPFRILLKDQLNPCKWCESGSSYNHWLCRWVSVKFSFLRFI